jgi:hypothetical protein
MQFLNAAASLDTTESEPLPRVSELKRHCPIIGLLHFNLRIVLTRRRTSKLRHSRRSGTWPAIIVFEFHKPVNCPARRLLPAAPGSAEK